jgi:hypothetical protein
MPLLSSGKEVVRCRRKNLRKLHFTLYREHFSFDAMSGDV